MYLFKIIFIFFQGDTNLEVISEGLLYKIISNIV